MATVTIPGRVRKVVPSIGDELDNPKIAVAAALFVILLPLLPFLAVVWTISRTLQGVRERVSWE